jgi:hypothetical protein
MGSAAFKRLAWEGMSAGDRKALDFIGLDPVPAVGGLPEFVSRWREWEAVLRLNLAKNRAARLKRELAADVPDYPADAAAAAKAAFAMESPLEAEIFLDKARWNAIENFQGIGIFTENAVYAYLLKLLLMERRAAFKAEEGFSEYKTLHASILEGAGKTTTGEQPK